MRYNVQQFLNVILFFIGLYCLGLNFSSCRKADFHNSKLLVDRDRFFAIPDNSPQVLKRIISNLKIQEERKPFVENFIKNQGYPNWEYARINISEQNNSFLPDSDTLISVPIVLDEKHYVKSVLAIKVNVDIWFKLLEGIKYGELPIEKSVASGQVFTALDFLNLMMDMEAKIFGRNEFIIIDTAVLPSSYLLHELHVPDPIYGVQIHFVNGCTVIDHGYYENHVFVIQNSETLCLYETGELVYTLEPPDIGEGGGAGSGGSGPTNDECHRGFAGVSGFDENGNPMTACPDLQENQTPCEVAQNAAKKMDTLFTASKADSVLNTIPNLATETKEKGFPIYQNISISSTNPTDTSVTGYSSGAVQTGNDTSITIEYSFNPNTKRPTSWLHTHPDSGYAAHSPFDVYSLLEMAIESVHFQGAFVAASNGDKYVITITDSSKAVAFFNTRSQFLDGRKWNENSDIGKAYEKAYNYYSKNVYKDNSNKNNLAYEMAMAAVLKQFDAGVTLNKEDSNGNFKPIVINTTVIPRQGIFNPERTVYTQDCL